MIPPLTAQHQLGVSAFGPPTTSSFSALGCTASSRYEALPVISSPHAQIVNKNYATGCEDSFNCQQQIVDVDTSSSIRIYSLSTVATVWQISVNGAGKEVYVFFLAIFDQARAGVANNADNRNGFAQTVTVWTPN
jgi:hypothetical protein